MVLSCWAAAQGPGAFEECSIRHGIGYLGLDRQAAAAYLSSRFVPLHNCDALVASLNLSVRASV